MINVLEVYKQEQLHGEAMRDEANLPMKFAACTFKIIYGVVQGINFDDDDVDCSIGNHNCKSINALNRQSSVKYLSAKSTRIRHKFWTEREASSSPE